MKALIAILLAAILPGCGVPDAYAPAEQGVWYGYGEAPAGAGRAEIGYLGQAGETAAWVHYYVMLRAAEVTLQAGKGAFRIVSDQPGLGHREPVKQGYFDEDTNHWVDGGTDIMSRPLETLLIEVADRGAAGTEDAVALAQQAEMNGELLEKRTIDALAAWH